MASYHFSVQAISRKAGRSSTAAAAYRAAKKIVDERTGEIHDYTRKRGVIDSELFLPGEQAHARGAFWSSIEQHHKRGDAVVAREFTLALPHELNPNDQCELAFAYGRELSERYGVAVDVAVHRADKGGDKRNVHAHVLMSGCHVDRDGTLGKKAVELDPIHCQKHRIENFAERERPRWATLANEWLAERSIEARLDHRTLAAQGIDRIPTEHLGPTATAILRRGGASTKQRRLQEEAQRRIEAAAEMRVHAHAAALEVRQAEAALIDTQTSLQAALIERQAQRGVPHPAEQLARFRAAQAPAEPVLSAEERREKSRQDLTDALASMPDGGYRLFASPTNIEHGRYSGTLLLSTDLHIAQDFGRREAVIHERTRLDGDLKVGQKVTIQYSDGRATVTPKHDHSLDRSRAGPRLR